MMTERQLRREIEDLNNEHKILCHEEKRICQSPPGIAHFEDYYVKKNLSYGDFENIVDNMEQFPIRQQMHMKEHFDVKRTLKRDTMLYRRRYGGYP